MLENNELRLRLKRLLVHEPMSYRKLYRAIGIEARTLQDFFNNRRSTSIESLSKIEKYLKEKGIE